MRFSKIFSSLTAIAMALFVSVSACAYRDVIKLETFESYGNKIGGSWRAQGRETTAPIVETDRGKAVKIVSDSAKMLEVFQDFSATSSAETSFLFVFSAKYGGANCMRSLYTRNNTKEYPLMDIDPSAGYIQFGRTGTKHNMEIKNGVWYDFQFEFNAATGYARCSIYAQDEETVIEGNLPFNGLTGLWRVNFPSFLTAGGESETYITNAGVYALGYDVAPFAQYVSRGEKFENFSHSSNGLTAPEGWSLQGTEEGSTAIYCREASGSPYGKSLVMYWDGEVSKTFELLRENLEFESKASITLDLMRDEGSAANIQIRGVNDNGRNVNYARIASIDSAGTLKVDDEEVCSMDASKWYNLRFDFDTDTGTYYLTVKDGEATYVSDETSIPRSIVDIKVFGFRFISDSMTETCFYIDNCFFESGEVQDADVQISGFKTAIRDITPLDSAVDFALSGDFDSSFVQSENITASVNGSAIDISSLSISGNTLTVELGKSFEPGNAYMVEVTGDNGLGASRMFFCRNLLDLSAFGYNKDNVEPGVLQCSIKLASYTDAYDSCFVVSVLRDKATNAMVQADYKSFSLSPTPNEATLTLNVPAEGEYVAETFIWKSVFNMQSIFPSKELK